MAVSPFFALLFFFFPMPVKILMILIGGLFFMGAKNHDEVILPAPAGAVQAPEEKAAQADQAAQVVGEPVEEPRNVPLLIVVFSDGSYQFAGKKLTGPELVAALKPLGEARPKTLVEIKADARTPHQMVANARKLCHEAGLAHLRFVPKPVDP